MQGSIRRFIVANHEAILTYRLTLVWSVSLPRQANNSNSEDGPLRVLVHVDGVQISKSGTKKEFWTVLMKASSISEWIVFRETDVFGSGILSEEEETQR